MYGILSSKCYSPGFWAWFLCISLASFLPRLASAQNLLQPGTLPSDNNGSETPKKLPKPAAQEPPPPLRTVQQHWSL
ncbi:MAG TPA: hypothetical protein VH325_02665, partial [Bryobacteraceae bacterium]|nr:hypothetical protein [Bryobacteraceae bacterium]